MDIFLWWIILGVVAATIAKSKGYSFFLWLLYGVIIPIVAIPHAILKDAHADVMAARSGDTQKCPFCAEMIKAAAIVCKHCGRDLPLLTEETQ